MMNAGNSMQRDRIQNTSPSSAQWPEEKSSTDEKVASSMGRENLLRTLSAKYALTIVVQWHPGVTLDDGILKAKADEVKSRAFTVSPKNIYGLEGGAILYYWENGKDQLANLVRTYLSKRTTWERMRGLDVLSITFHKNCRIRLSPEPFRSCILDGGKVTIFRFKTASMPEVSSLLTPSKSPAPKQCDKPELSNSAKPWFKNEVHHEISASQAPPGRSQQPEIVSGHANLQGRNDSGERLPPRGPRAARRAPQKPYSNGAPVPSPSSVAISSTPQKRPRSLPDTDENNIGGKRPRNAACSSDRDAASSGQSDLSRRLDKPHDLPISRSASWKERGAQTRNNSMHQVHDDTKLDLQRAGEAEKHALRRDDELESHTNKLRGRIRELEEAYESSRDQVSRLREALEESESARRSLGESLQSVQSDYKESQFRETELQQALHDVLLDLEETRKHGSKAVQELREERSLAEMARKKAEEDRQELMDRLRTTEEALATEQLQRKAAEETFLDVKCVLSGIDIFSKNRD